MISLSPKKAQQLLEMSKKRRKTVTGLFSGHCQMRYQLNKIDKSHSERCRCCESVAQTAEHLLSECQALFCMRLKFLEGVKLMPSDIKKLAASARSLKIPVSIRLTSCTKDCKGRSTEMCELAILTPASPPQSTNRIMFRVSQNVQFEHRFIQSICTILKNVSLRTISMRY